MLMIRTLTSHGRRGAASKALRTRPGRSAGFSLLEVLISLLVLSLGLLGLAGLQATTVQYNHGAYLRSQATSLAYDMADRLRANRRAALDDPGAYDDVDYADPDCGDSSNGSVADRDIAAWHSALACALPLGDGQVERNDRLFTITVRWDESRGQAAEADLETFEMTTGL